MSSEREISLKFLAINLSLTAIIYFIDTSLPLVLTSGGLLYVLPLLHTVLIAKKGNKHLVHSAVVCTGFVFISYFQIMQLQFDWSFLLNRLIAVLVIWAAVYLGRLYLSAIQIPGIEPAETIDGSGESKGDPDTDKEPKKTIGFIEEQWRAMVESSPNHIILLDLDYTIVSTNYAISGVPKEDVIGKPILDLIPEQYKEISAQKFEKALSSGALTKYETEYQLDNGEVVFYENFVNPILVEGKAKFLLINALDVTNSKTILRSLQQSEEKYRSLTNNLDIGIYRALPGDQGKSLEINPAVLKIFGYKNKREYMKLPPSVLYENPEDRILFNEKLLKRGFIKNEKFHYKKKDGSLIICSETAVAVKDEEGNVLHFDGILEDITERVKLEEELHYRMEFEKLITGISTHFINLSIDDIFPGVEHALETIGKFASVDRCYIFRLEENSKVMENIFEWCEDDIQPSIDALRYISVEEFPWFCKKILNKEVVHVVDMSDIPDYAISERERFASLDIKSFINVPLIVKGETVGFLGFDSVKSRKAWAEDEIKLLEVTGGIFVSALSKRKAEKALLESEAKFRQYFELGVIGMAKISSERKFIDVNDSFCELFEYSKEDLINLTWENLNHPDDLDTSNKFFSSFTSGEVDWLTFEKRFLTKGGSTVYAVITVRGIKGTGEEVDYYLVHVQDITQSKEQEAEKALLEEQLLRAQKVESLGRLAGGIAHDFNNLLQSLYMNLSMSKSFADKDSKIYDLLEKTEDNLQSFENLTHQLLTFSEGGKPVKRVVVIKDLITKAVDFALSGSTIECEFLLDDDLHNCTCDEGQISQVLNNLTINAKQAMPDGGKITVSAKNKSFDAKDNISLSEGDYVEIAFKDTGIGIPERDISKIFDPFFTTKKTGSGIGLATSYSIIKKHGGDIFAESKIGKGTTFVFYLEATEEQTVEKEKLTPSKANGHANILVMDDDEQILNSLEEGMELIGFGYKGVLKGEDAYDAYVAAFDTENKFTIVLLDLTVKGGMGGKDTVKRLLEFDPAVKAIASSGYSDDPIISQYKSYGFKGALPKPYVLSQLLEMVNELSEE